MSDLTELCKKLEHFETPQWAAEAILKREVMTNMVVDPCAGSGVLYHAIKSIRPYAHAYNGMDIHDWGFPCKIVDFLSLKKEGDDHQNLNCMDWTCFMNPPFSLAEQFVEKSFELGARKIIMFQRFAFWESAGRRAFWDKYPPVKVYVCGDRADCWRHDLAILPPEKRINPKNGKKMSSSPTAHAWFVFEKGHKGGTILDRLYKAD